MMKKMLLVSLLIFGIVSVKINAQSLKIPSVSDAGTLVLPADKAGFEKGFLAALDPGKDLGISADNLGKTNYR